jgi:signal transduction histidine kinase
MATGSGRRTPSLRRRLIVGIVVTASVAAFAEAVLLHVVWFGYERRLIDRIVLEELRRSVEIHPRDPQLAYPNTEDLRLYVAALAPEVAGDLLPPHLVALLEPPPPLESSALHTVRSAQGLELRVGVTRRGPRVFLLVYDARDHEKRRTDLLWVVLAIAVMLSLVSSRIALGLVDRLLGGLSRLQRRVSAGPAEDRFRDDRMDVEVAALADALDDHRRQVVAALRKERAFAAAASHELRTPLTRIATGTEVLLARDDLPEPVAPRLRSIRESADELQRLLEVLLEVARWQPSGPAPPPLPPKGPPRLLGALVQTCVERLAGEARLLGTRIAVSIADPGYPVSHPAMLELVLGNLLRNAIRHGRSAPVEIRAADGVVEVTDGGPGIAPAELDRIFDPFWRGAGHSEETGPSGLGLGLTIAERVCAAAGWTLSIRSGPEQGTRASVRLARPAGA